MEVQNSICLIWGSFLRNIEDSEKKISEKFTRNSTFFLLFSHNLGAKSCNSLVWRRHSRWTALYNGGIAASTHKNNHFSETSSTKISQFDISKEPNNWTKCPVTGHKISVCHTLGTRYATETAEYCHICVETSNAALGKNWV